MHARRGPTTPKDKSRELQRKLYRAAKRSRNRRFHALYDRIFQPDVLWRAWEEVRKNGVLLQSRNVRGITSKAAGRRLSESRMRENLTSGSRWQGMETRIGHRQVRHSQRKRGANR